MYTMSRLYLYIFSRRNRFVSISLYITRLPHFPFKFRPRRSETFIIRRPRVAVSSIKFPVGTKFQPGAKLLASLNVFGLYPTHTYTQTHTQSVQFPSGRMEKGSPQNATINK